MLKESRMPNSKKGNKPKSNVAEEATALPEGEAAEVNPGDPNENVVLAAIASLRSELHMIKTDICDKIDERIADVSVTLRAEIAALKTETDASITTLKAQAETQAEMLHGLEQSASHTTDIVAELEAQVKRLTGQVD